jgi:hypothetical protein
LKRKNKNGDSALDILRQNLEKVKKIRNPSAEVRFDTVISYLKNPHRVPFNIDSLKRKFTKESKRELLNQNKSVSSE